jgi:hypothetical protein
VNVLNYLLKKPYAGKINFNDTSKPPSDKLTELLTLATAEKGKEKKKRHPNLRLFKDMDNLWNSTGRR